MQQLEVMDAVVAVQLGVVVVVVREAGLARREEQGLGGSTGSADGARTTQMRTTSQEQELMTARQE